ncbi:gp401 [Bacillus phage G]|uniref:Gp401 n=1 Tax=Bacillus phage G TaxID=2884420 RepID=G3MAE2_9CAUD|nr:gp401 [Bacillus phage G]AEO93660.1 gp401 [Bacillus phage G]
MLFIISGVLNIIMGIICMRLNKKRPDFFFKVVIKSTRIAGTLFIVLGIFDIIYENKFFLAIYILINIPYLYTIWRGYHLSEESKKVMEQLVEN